MFRRVELLMLLGLPTLAAVWLCCGSPPAPRPVKGKEVLVVDYRGYEQLLGRYLDDQGRVDYQRWQDSDKDVGELDDFLVALRAGPPGPEADSAAALSYWMNLYNALVIREVLRRWPLESVRDVRAGLLNGSLGFFRGLSFQVGDTEMTLDDIEHRVIREQFSDARIHFALNCGARSCPPIKPLAFSAARLDRELERAAREFLANRHNFAVDHEQRTVYLSKLFDWYRKDFERHAERSGRPGEVLAFVELVADESVAREARSARGYKKRYRAYDWSVNRGAVERQATCAPAIGTALPALSLAERDDRFRFPRARPLVIDVWASYCKPCRRTLPALAELAAEYPGIDVIALSVDDERALVERFLREVPLSLPVVLGGDQALGELRVPSLPTLIAVDGKGVVRGCITGAPTEGRVAAVLDSLADR
ncbi:MAG: DUF547 domain-containing protein [Deltaproteobacteria bacterium]|nr:DUF547 domain-containing protein [Deltaproteobacteria bacterium]